MKKSTYMDRALRAADPRFARVLSKLGYQRRDVVAAEPTPDDLTLLRAEYTELTGKRFFHGWDEAELRAKIADARAGNGE